LVLFGVRVRGVLFVYECVLRCILEFIGFSFRGLLGTGAVCVGLSVLYVAICMVLLSAGAVWIFVLFCVVIINGVEYRVLGVKWYL
jgi:hypothetical protein